MAEDIKIDLPEIDLSDIDIDIPDIELDKTFKLDAKNKLDIKEIQDSIKVNLTRNNILDTNKKEDSKKAKFNPLSFIRFIPEMLPAAVAMDAKDAELINQGKDPKFFPVRKGQADLAKDIHRGILEGPILAVKGIAELATSGIDIAASKINLDTNFTKKLDTITRDYLEEHGNPQTWQGDVTKLVGEYGYPGTLALKIVNNLGKINSVGKTYKALRSSLSKIENKYLRRGAKFITSIAKYSGQAGLSLSITDAVVKDSREDTYKLKKISEEGKSGKDLAVARLLNKIRFGAEGTVIGGVFGIVGKAAPFAAKYGIYKPGSVVLGTGFKAADKLILNPFTQIIARTPGVRATAKTFNTVADFLAREVGGRTILPFIDKNVFLKSFQAKLPPFKKWGTFSVTNSDPLKAALRKVDNKLQYLRSVANKTKEQFEITTEAKNLIKTNARESEKLLKSIEVRAYNLAKSFEKQYNTATTSPASQEKYLNDVLEYMQGQRQLGALPKELQVTAEALNKTFIETKKMYGDLLPAGDLKNLILKNVDSYMRKSFAIFTNPAYLVPETSKLFTDAVKFARGVVERSPNLIKDATKQFGGDDVTLNQIKDSAAKDMVRKILRLGKQDSADPIINLQNISKFLDLKRFIGTGDELPTVIKNLLGKENSLKGSVLATNAAMNTQISNKLMYDKLGPVLQKAGILFKSPIDAKRAGIVDPVPLTKADGIGLLESKLIDPKNPYYGGKDIIDALQDTTQLMDSWIRQGWYKNMLQIKTGVQYGKTVLSPETQVRNFFSAGLFPVARGLIGGRASVTESIKMVVDDIFAAGKGDPAAELRLLENVKEGIKYGVLDENIVASELQAVLREVKNGTITSTDGLANFLAKNKITDTATRLYAGGDNVWKWYTYNWYKSFTKDLFKGDVNKARKWFKDIADLDAPPGDIDELIKKASAWYTTNTVPTYSKVPPVIQILRRTPLGNFVSFPAEMLRTTFNNLNISMREAASDDPTLRAMGIRGLVGMYVTLGGLFSATKALYNSMTGFNDEQISLYKKYFAPDYEKNSQILPITKVKDGKFKAVNMSDFIPQAAVTEPIEAFFNTRKNNIMEAKDVTNSLLAQFTGPNGPVMTFLDSYISPAIGLEPFMDVFARGGVTKNGTRIYSETDDDSTKISKWLTNTLARTFEPGVVTSGRKLKDAIFKQPSASGQVKEVSDVVIGASTGIKPFAVDILEKLDYTITDYTRIRSNVFKAENFYKFKDLYRRGGDVLVEEFIAVQKEAFREQKKIYLEIQAAKQFDLSDSDIRKLFKRRKGISDKAIRLIMSGKFNPVTFSEDQFENKLRKLSKIEDEQGFTYDLPKDFLFPKGDLKRVIRELQRDDLNEPFYYDVQKEKEAMDLRGDVPTGIETIQQEPVRVSQKPQTPPLPTTPMPNQQVIQTAMMPASGVMNQGLTATENALLSEEEKQIRLRSRGLA
jgi:hypothetical protein